MGKGCSQKPRQKRSSSTLLREFQPQTKRINGSTSINRAEVPLTEISDWNLKRKSNGKLFLQGIKSDDPLRRLWQSSTILKRLNNRSFMTISKKTYKLVGNINWKTAEADGWPQHLITKYSGGIPYKWRHFIELHVNRSDRSRNSSGESCMTNSGASQLDSHAEELRKSSDRPDGAGITQDEDLESSVSSIQMHNITLNLIKKSTSFFQEYHSTPVTRSNSSSQHMEIHDDIISPIRTENHGRVTRRNQPCPNQKLVRRIDLWTAGNTKRNQRRTRSSLVPYAFDVAEDIIEDIPARNTPTHVAVANKCVGEVEKVQPVEVKEQTLVPKRLFLLRECKVILKDVGAENVPSKQDEEVVKKNTKPKKLGRCLRDINMENVPAFKPGEEVVKKNTKTKMPKKSAGLAKPRVKSRAIIKVGKKMKSGDTKKSAPDGSLKVADFVVPKDNKLTSKNVLQSYEAITSKPGTLKHKQQLRQFLNDCNNCPSDTDFLSQELPKNGLNKMVGDFVAGDEFSMITDVSSSTEGGLTPKRQNVIMTPVSERKTPAGATFSPTYLHKINWTHVDKYMLQRKAAQKLKAKQRLLSKPAVVKRKVKRNFRNISLDRLKLLPVRMGSDEENMETSCEES